MKRQTHGPHPRGTRARNGETRAPQPMGAGAPLDVLVNQLAKYGWGDLTGQDLRGVRNVLYTLGTLLDRHSGTGSWSVKQIATKAGYSEAWTRGRLQILEELDILEWRRGGIDAGSPVPSWFRVNKARLVELVNIAREVRDAQLLVIRLAFLARLATLRVNTQWFRGKKRRSDHTKPRLALPLTGTAPGAAAGPVPAETAPPPPDPVPIGDLAARVSALRAQIRPLRT